MAGWAHAAGCCPSLVQPSPSPDLGTRDRCHSRSRQAGSIAEPSAASLVGRGLVGIAVGMVVVGTLVGMTVVGMYVGLKVGMSDVGKGVVGASDLKHASAALHGLPENRISQHCWPLAKARPVMGVWRLLVHV